MSKKRVVIAGAVLLSAAGAFVAYRRGLLDGLLLKTGLFEEAEGCGDDCACGDAEAGSDFVVEPVASGFVSQQSDSGKHAIPVDDDDDDDDDEIGDVADGPKGSHPPLADGGQPEGFPIKGNADSMLYHVPGTAHYKRTVAEIWFATDADAEAAGYLKPKSQR